MHTYMYDMCVQVSWGNSCTSMPKAIDIFDSAARRREVSILLTWWWPWVGIPGAELVGCWTFSKKTSKVLVTTMAKLTDAVKKTPLQLRWQALWWHNRRVLGSGDHVVAYFDWVIFHSPVSACSFTYTSPGSDETQQKWCNFLMARIILNSGAKKWSSHRLKEMC